MLTGTSRGRWTWIVALVTVLAVLIPAPAAIARSRVAVSSFERNFQGWSPDHFIECEQDASCAAPFDWSITRSQEQAKHGRFSLEAFLPGI